MRNLGLDIGTKNIILAYKDKENKRKIKYEVNGFLRIPKSDGFTKQLLVNSGVPYLEYGSDFIALGKKAEELSYAFNRTMQRPMVDGVISGKTDEAMEIMAIIIKEIIGKVEDGATLYYCIPADALNRQTNVQFHDKIIKMIMSQLGSEKLQAHPINEARALVIGQVEDKTGVGISWGAGMVNVCYCLYGIEIFKFSIVGAGDRIDMDSAMRFGYDPKEPGGDYRETPTSICRRKEKMDLNSCPDDAVGKAIWINYGLMIEDVIKNIIDGFNRNEEKARVDRPIPVVIAGGTSSPEGFTEYVQKIIGESDMPFEVECVKRAEKPLYAVAEGCLIASEMHQED
jgi:hypothetical protein